ncbi:MAG: alpha/beta hydrolase [Burkholderiaceae bacterium]|nr:alpha/beta hydrolase [Burkholderiaceae bacterium]
MNRHTQIFFLAGAAGQIECALDLPESAPRGIALIAHPHPLYGGTMDNKVVATLGRAFIGVGFAVARMNFRGVGQTQGQHDQGRGETDDMALLLTYMKQQYPGLPVVLGGFSFGTFVQASLQQRLTAQGEPVERLILVSATAGKWSPPPVPSNTILVQGDMDDTILLKDVLDWARPQDIPVIVVPGCDHLFNRKLHHLRQIVTDTWRA